MKLFKQRDIVLVPYPFTDQSESKVRPAIVISNNNYNNKNIDLILVPITSVIKEDSHSILIDNSDLEVGEILKISRVKFDKIFSLEKRIILKKIAILSNERFMLLRKSIVELF